jgi:hypothetical protein
MDFMKTRRTWLAIIGIALNWPCLELADSVDVIKISFDPGEFSGHALFTAARLP